MKICTNLLSMIKLINYFIKINNYFIKIKAN